MPTTIKYPVKEVEIQTIPRNRMLSMGITQSQRLLCEQSIRRYGLLTPIVLVEKASGELITLSGENELEILREMKVAKADVFVTELKSPSDTCRAILLLSSLKKGLNALSEGLILRELKKTGNFTQKELAASLMKSKSWVSKRLTLAEQLNTNVAEMVLAKQLCPASAQEISRLPEEAQHTFAMEVYTKNIPKSTVERLVSAYANQATPEAVKQEIIQNPSLAAQALTTATFEKCADAKQDPSRLDAALRLVLKLVAEIEAHLAGMAEVEAKRYDRLLPVVCRAMGRLIRLTEHRVSPGKPESRGACHDH